MESTPVTQPETNPSTVTKTKNPGRIAAGKKLVEHNKQNKVQKQNIKKKTEEKESTSVTLSEPKETSSDAKSSYITYVIFGVGIAAAVAAKYLYKIYKPNHTCPPRAEPAKAKKAEEISSRRIVVKDLFEME